MHLEQGPGEHGPASPPRQPPPELLTGLREEPAGSRHAAPRIRISWRWPVLAVALVPVLAAVGVVALLPSGPGGAPARQQAADRPRVTSTPPSPAGTPAQTRTSRARPSTAVRNVTPVPPGKASERLDAAGIDPGGRVAGAWTWADANGTNMLVTSTAAGSAPGSYDLRVTRVARLDGRARVLRVMREPGVPRCTGSTSGTAGFTATSVLIQDLDGDGVAETSVGWAFRCGGSGAHSTVKLSLLSGGTKYILRGRGVIGRPGQGSVQPDPRPQRWPEPFLNTLTSLFHRLYF